MMIYMKNFMPCALELMSASFMIDLVSTIECFSKMKFMGKSDQGVKRSGLGIYYVCQYSFSC